MHRSHQIGYLRELFFKRDVCHFSFPNFLKLFFLEYRCTICNYNSAFLPWGNLKDGKYVLGKAEKKDKNRPYYLMSVKLPCQPRNPYLHNFCKTKFSFYDFKVSSNWLLHHMLLQAIPDTESYGDHIWPIARIVLERLVIE